uniref:(northern house mosquito) hypothetical protein n=1 Tax=Culex pipiens TaxID=7175 RepID=A0A8D8J6L9_CULPI
MSRHQTVLILCCTVQPNSRQPILDHLLPFALNHRLKALVQLERRIVRTFRRRNPVRNHWIALQPVIVLPQFLHRRRSEVHFRLLLLLAGRANVGHSAHRQNLPAPCKNNTKPLQPAMADSFARLPPVNEQDDKETAGKRFI